MSHHCVPPAVRAAADAAQDRKDRAIERLRSLAVEEGAVEEDPFLHRMGNLIDADERVVHLRRHA